MSTSICSVISNTVPPPAYIVGMKCIIISLATANKNMVTIDQKNGHFCDEPFFDRFAWKNGHPLFTMSLCPFVHVCCSYIRSVKIAHEESLQLLAHSMLDLVIRVFNFRIELRGWLVYILELGLIFTLIRWILLFRWAFRLLIKWVFRLRLLPLCCLRRGYLHTAHDKAG